MVRIIVSRAVFRWVVFEGDDSCKVFYYRTLSYYLAKHKLCGTLLLKTAANKIPQGLDSKDLDDWLLRREKAKRPGRPVNFHDRSTFSGFRDLSVNNDITDGPYASGDEYTYSPRRHWLFLVKIIASGISTRLQMNLKILTAQRFHFSSI